MLLNPINRTLWDEEGRLLKRLFCPKGATASDLRDGACRICDREVLALDRVPEAEALARLRADPDLCVSLRLDAPNLRILPHDPV